MTMTDDRSELSLGPPGHDQYVPPSADRYDVKFCGECPNAHILLRDADGRGIAQMTMSYAQALRLVFQIEEEAAQREFEL
jgi:hypothetical protein